jgi:hypothetical protein
MDTNPFIFKKTPWHIVSLFKVSELSNISFNLKNLKILLLPVIAILRLISIIFILILVFLIAKISIAFRDKDETKPLSASRKRIQFPMR